MVLAALVKSLVHLFNYWLALSKLFQLLLRLFIDFPDWNLRSLRCLEVTERACLEDFHSVYTSGRTICQQCLDLLLSNVVGQLGKRVASPWDLSQVKQGRQLFISGLAEHFRLKKWHLRLAPPALIESFWLLELWGKQTLRQAFSHCFDVEKLVFYQIQVLMFVPFHTACLVDELLRHFLSFFWVSILVPFRLWGSHTTFHLDVDHLPWRSSSRFLPLFCWVFPWPKVLIRLDRWHIDVFIFNLG